MLIVLQFIAITTTTITTVNANYIDLSSSYSLLRGSPYIDDQYNIDITTNSNNKEEEDEEHRKMINLRKLLQQSSDHQYYYSSLSPSKYNNNSTLSSSSTNSAISHEHTTRYNEHWLNLTINEIQLLSYDKSSLNYINQNLLGSVYLVGRGRQSSSTAHATADEQQQFETLDESSAYKSTADNDSGNSDNGWSITSFLRGKSTSTTINTKDRLSPPRRKLQQWTMHTGNDNSIPPPPPSSSSSSNSDSDIQAQSSSTSNTLDSENNEDTNNNSNNAEQDDISREELMSRLNIAVQTVQELNTKHIKYDTNTKYEYSNPNFDIHRPPPKPDDFELEGEVSSMQQMSTNSNENNENIQNMEQLSHTQKTTRQRLLTGSYAAWQWYDRSSLATPTNLNLQKVSRINYSFFQTNSNGYIYGTDSWADPNVLFGPYEFATSSDELSKGCKGGNGRDDGFVVGDSNSYWSGAKNQDESHDNSNLAFGDTSSSSTGGGGDSSASGFTTRRRSLQNKDGTPCKYFEQCHRNFPNSKSCNIHKYKEGLIYRAHTSGAQIYPSIGGWTLSGSFPDVAADVNKRKRFARECVGLIADYGFDGIDIGKVVQCHIFYYMLWKNILFLTNYAFVHLSLHFLDWEYPGYEPHGGSPRDRENFNKLLLEVREALNDYQLASGDEPLGGGAFGLTAGELLF